MKITASKQFRIAAVALAVGAALFGTVALVRASDGTKAPATAKPALTVTLATPEKSEWPGVFSASGNIVAWQEAIIGAEANGLRINDVRANVGDRVTAGQVLATFAPETVEAELAQSKAQVAEAEAALAEAQANADRAKTLENTGALSAQQIQQFLTAAKTAEATNTVQAIGRGAVAAYERDGKLCPTVAHPIPSSPESIRGRKYMAGPTEWRDAGFDCLRFEMSLPQYYTYEYRSRGDTFEVIARGDLNGDGVLSTHVLRGRVENGAVVMAPSIEVTDPEE